MPIALNLARIFGFQQEQPRELGSSFGGEMAPSNVACQVDNLCSLLVNRMQPRRLGGMEGAFRAAVGELHAKTFGNYEHWCHHVGLTPADTAAFPPPDPKRDSTRTRFGIVNLQ